MTQRRHEVKEKKCCSTTDWPHFSNHTIECETLWWRPQQKKKVRDSLLHFEREKDNRQTHALPPASGRNHSVYPRPSENTPRRPPSHSHRHLCPLNYLQCSQAFATILAPLAGYTPTTFSTLHTSTKFQIFTSFLTCFPAAPGGPHPD